MKLVKEHLNEFHKTGDIRSSLKIGKGYIIKWLGEMGIEDGYTINDDLTIDSHKDVNLDDMGLTEFPEFIQWNVAEKNFYCDNNRLKSLRGAPNFVGEDFDCQNNTLESLEGGPDTIHGDFNCNHNSLVSLKSSPDYVGGFYDCTYNRRRFSRQDVQKVCRVMGNIYV